MFEAINGLPTNYTKYAYIVVLRDPDGGLWYYDGWNDRAGANQQAQEEGGIVLTVGH
jgi:hypothetical protein